jgi:hypothetical protein
MIRSAIAVGLAVAACGELACASMNREPSAEVTPSPEIPAAWLDLPDAPFEVAYVGPKAVLMDRKTGQEIFQLAVGCVREISGRVSVVSTLWIQESFHGAWSRDYPETQALHDIARIYKEPELFARFDPPRRPCPADTNVSITQAVGRQGFKWSADGTPWPLGPPRDTRNAWRVSSKKLPAFDYVEHGGCGYLDAFGSNKTQTELIWVRLDLNPKKMPSAKRPLVVRLTGQAASEKLQLLVYQTDRHDWFCSDAFSWDAEEATSWIPTRATLTVWANPPKNKLETELVTIQISDAEFVGPGGATIRPPRAIVIKTLAGGMVGG